MKITSWGNLFKKNIEEVSLDNISDASVVGNQRSYNNIAFGNKIVFNRKNGMKIDDDILTVDSGALMEDVIEYCLKYNYFPYVTPGTKKVSIGGCVAANVHGKSHHVYGSFCDHIVEMLVLKRDGSKQTLTRDNEEFFDHCGGFGIPGIVLKIKMKVMDIGNNKSFKTRHLSIDSIREAMYLLEVSDKEYTVAWINTSSKNGAGFVIEGDWGDQEALSSKKKINIPVLPSFILNNKYVFSILNHLQYFKMKMENMHKDAVSIDEFLFPLDKFNNWDNAYGEKGMMQCQIVTDGAHYALIEDIYSMIKDCPYKPFITVLKKFGGYKVSDFYGKSLNFQKEDGFTLAIDLPVNKTTLKLVSDIENLTKNNNGGIYLAKNPHSSKTKELINKDFFEKYSIDHMDYFKSKTEARTKIVVVGSNSTIFKDMLLKTDFLKNIAKGAEFILASKDKTVDDDVKNIESLGFLVKSVKMDLTNGNSVNNFLKYLEDANMLIIAAGLLDQDAKEEDDVIKVNQTSPLKIINKFIKNNQTHQEIVYMSSVTSMRGKASTINYSASKRFMEMYLEGLMMSNVNLSVYIPRFGFVNTNMTKNMDLPKSLTISSVKAAEFTSSMIKNEKTGLRTQSVKWIVLEATFKLLPYSLWKKIDKVRVGE